MGRSGATSPGVGVISQPVHVMKTDIAREPLRDSGQLVERATLQCSFRVIPLVAALPVSPFKLMLDVEQPNSWRACERRHSDWDHQIRFEAYEEAHDACHHGDRKVHPTNRESFSPGYRGRREAMSFQSGVSTSNHSIGDVHVCLYGTAQTVREVSVPAPIPASPVPRACSRHRSGRRQSRLPEASCRPIRPERHHGTRDAGFPPGFHSVLTRA